MSETISDTFAEQRTSIFSLMSKLGITHVEIDFNGSGDSGSIEDIRCENRLNLIIGLPIRTIEPTLAQLTQIKDFGYMVLEQTNIDWYNSEGGYGQINLSLDDDSIDVAMNVRILGSEYSAYSF